MRDVPLWLKFVVALGTVAASTVAVLAFVFSGQSTPVLIPSGGASTPVKSPGPTPSPTSAATPTNPFLPGRSQLPEQLTGTWKGSVLQQDNSQTYAVVLKLSRMPGTAIGTSSYPTLNCEGMLQLNEVSFDTVVITEYITVGAANPNASGCGTPDQITLKYLDKNHLLYTFAYAGNPTDGQATLTRSTG